MIFFLDFDGVLHPFFPSSRFSDEENGYFSAVPALEAAVRASGDFEIVISSSWRKSHTLDAMRLHFSPDFASRIIGITPTLEGGYEPGGRQAEVEAWLAAAGREDEAWVAIDDSPELYRSDAPLVVCDDIFGEREAQRLMEAAANPAAFGAKRLESGGLIDIT